MVADTVARHLKGGEILRGVRWSIGVALGVGAFMLSGSGWAEVTFDVDPGRAVVEYQTTTVSSSEQKVLLGHSGTPLSIPKHLVSGQNDGGVFFFRDPLGEFKTTQRKLGRAELSDGAHIKVELEPLSWKGYGERFWWQILTALGLASIGGFFALRSRLTAQKLAESDSALAVFESEEDKRRAEIAKLEAMGGCKLDEGLTHFNRKGRFYMIRPLKSGGFGEVWMGCPIDDLRPESRVAVKLIKSGIEKMPEFIDRFKRETKVALSLKHENIVPVIDYSFEGDIFLAMKFIEGKDLRDLLDGQPERRLPLKVAISVFYEICAGVECLHFNNVAHRDLKPENVMMARRAGSEFGKPVLIDLGAARDVEDKLSQTTFQTQISPEGNRNVIFSPGYTPPELYLSTDTMTCASPKIDQYALGIILTELVTGKTPAPTFHDTLTGNIVDIGERAELPQGFIEAAKKMTAMDPQQRFETVREARETLQARWPQG